MKTKKILIVLMLLMTGMMLPAQNRPRAERIEAQRVAFITEKLKLTPDEAQRFWPVYNEYRQKRMKIEQRKTAIIRSYTSAGNGFTDQKAEKIADEYVGLGKEQADLLVEYNEKFKKVLSPRKVLELYKAEKQFTTYLLRQIRDRQRRENPPPRKY